MGKKVPSADLNAQEIFAQDWEAYAVAIDALTDALKAVRKACRSDAFDFYDKYMPDASGHHIEVQQSINLALQQATALKGGAIQRFVRKEGEHGKQ